MENYFLNINSNNIGGYFSSEQIDLLTIIQCENDFNKLVNFILNCDQIKYLYSEDKIKELQSLNIEEAKRIVFEDYQNTMSSHYANADEIIENQLNNIGIKKDHFPIIKNYLKERNIKKIKEFIEENYSNYAEQIIAQNHHFTAIERDQLKSPDIYNELSILNSQLQSFNTLLIGSGKVYNVVNDFYSLGEDDNKRYDFYKVKRDLDFAYKNGKQVRFHSLLVKNDHNLFAGKTKDEIKLIIEDYVKKSIDFINDYNSTHKIYKDGKMVPVINAVDLFNEIISFNENTNGEYYNIWEEKYNITIEEIVQMFEYAKTHKPEGVSYLYNEPFLEDDVRRKKVFETMQMIDSKSEGLIDTLGSQMHITITEDVEKIKRCFDDFKKLQQTTGKKIQITEFDMSLGKNEIIRVFGNNTDVSLEQVYDYKRKQISYISNIINNSQVTLSGVSYWSLTDGIDCNLERIREKLLNNKHITDINQILTTCGGLIPTHMKYIKSKQYSPFNNIQSPLEFLKILVQNHENIDSILNSYNIPEEQKQMYKNMAYEEYKKIKEEQNMNEMSKENKPKVYEYQNKEGRNGFVNAFLITIITTLFGSLCLAYMIFSIANM